MAASADRNYVIVCKYCRPNDTLGGISGSATLVKVCTGRARMLLAACYPPAAIRQSRLDDHDDIADGADAGRQGMPIFVTDQSKIGQSEISREADDARRSDRRQDQYGQQASRPQKGAAEAVGCR